MLWGVADRSDAPARDYRSDQREAQARLTRQRVVDAATAVFLERGYAATTMRAIAAQADVAVPTVEVVFGKKSRLLKAAIDVARAGDDEPVAVLDRDWTAAARAATSAEELLAIVARVLAPAQVRSAGLVLAVFEGAAADAELAELAVQLIEERATTAAWLVDRLRRVASLRKGCTRQEAIDTIWILIDPAVFDRLTRQRHWTAERYERWIAASIARLVVDGAAHPPSKPHKRRTR